MLNIGQTTLKNRLILAPMAGYTTPAFRRLMAENGCGMTVTEMISVKGLLYDNQKTKDLLKTSQAETARSVQLFGSNPQEFARAALLPALNGFDIIDVNMGCPVKKIVNNGEGSALMNTPETAFAIVKALAKTGKTVTVKTRMSPDFSRTVDFVSGLFGSGATLVAVHARTPEQMYSGSADYYWFSRLREKVRGLLALSGDIVDLSSLGSAISTGADAFLIGRGAVATPTIFADLQGSQAPSKLELTLKLLGYMAEDEGEIMAVKSFRKFVPYLLKGEKCKKERRHSINFISDMNQLKDELTCLITK